VFQARGHEPIGFGQRACCVRIELLTCPSPSPCRIAPVSNRTAIALAVNTTALTISRRHLASEGGNRGGSFFSRSPLALSAATISKMPLKPASAHDEK
jgi:hypothetical protein